jgi:hypothetical protein
MALFRTRSAAVFGIDAHLIDVEVDMYPGGNSRDFITVGMPDTAVRESRERIKSALLNSGFGYPNKSVTINLAPANVRKEGAGFDRLVLGTDFPYESGPLFQRAISYIEQAGLKQEDALRILDHNAAKLLNIG